ncbi:MAG: HAMP domain-containing protein [Nitrospirae bacterium]|nr:HAMP domain-containing protein [Nitrospirota bacterium]
MKNLKILLGLFIFTIASIIITGLTLNYLGIEHGHLLIKIGVVFIVVNIILYLLLLIFSVGRNLFNLYSEKKQKAIGSKFRTQLVFSFVGLTLIPSILLFILSNQLINNSIDTWFSIEVQKPVHDSLDIAKVFYSHERDNVKNHAELIAYDNSLLNNSRGNIVSGNLKSFFLTAPDADGSEMIINAFNGVSDTEIVSQKGGDIIRAASPVKYEGKITGVIVVEKRIPRDIVEKMEAIRKAYNDYNQISMQQHPVRFIYFLMLTIATLVIVFLALWISLRIAKGITVPIRSLAEATKNVAHGDLDFRIDLVRDDEIGLLINSFNKMLEDLKDGKQSLEKAYKESDRRRLNMEAILESINSGVIFFDRTGRIATMNNAACSMLNIEHDSMTDKGHKELTSRLQSEELSLMVKNLVESASGSIEKEIHIYINGRPMDLRVYMTTLKDSASNFTGTLVVFDNLTEIIMAQRALAWQEVARRVAHEIKNPLTPIKLSAERLFKKWHEKASDFDDVLTRSTKTIVKEVNSLRSLVDEFSKFGKMPKIHLEPADVKHIITEVAELYSNTKELEIIISLQETPRIELDREHIKRALINLMDNAIQSGTRKISLNSFYLPSFDLIRIEVIDEGAGISEENKEKLFSPYFSTKKDGTGLGLAIVNSIISKHRGYIRVKDNDPRGSRFIIELPVGH